MRAHVRDHVAMLNQFSSIYGQLFCCSCPGGFAVGAKCSNSSANAGQSVGTTLCATSPSRCKGKRRSSFSHNIGKPVKWGSNQHKVACYFILIVEFPRAHAHLSAPRPNTIADTHTTHTEVHTHTHFVCVCVCVCVCHTHVHRSDEHTRAKCHAS